MLSLISRAEALSRNPLLASVVLGVQAAHDPALAPHQAGDRVWLGEDEGPTVLDEALAGRLNAEACAAHAAICDQVAPPRVNLAYAGEIVLEAEGTDADVAIARCAEGLAALAKALGWKELTFIGGFAVPLVPANSDHATAASARGRLASRGIDDSYRDAIVVTDNDVSPIARDLLTVVRHEGSAPEIRFQGTGAACIGSLCQYANLHLDIYGTVERPRIMAAIDGTGLTVAVNGCRERFGEGGRIAGRRIDV